MSVCECGCGEPTSLASHTNTKRGVRRGEPLRYVHGHNRRLSGIEYIVDPDTGCWIWQRGRHSRGYGMAYLDGHTIMAHRLIWLRHRGPIPEGYELDHLCRNTSCVNPDHLEMVTHQVNMQRVWVDGR